MVQKNLTQKFQRAVKDTETEHTDKLQEIAMREKEIEDVISSNKKLANEIIILKNENKKSMNDK